MPSLARIKTEFIYLSSFLRVLSRIRHLTPDKSVTVADDIERWVQKKPDNIAIYFEDRTLTYRQLDEGANRYARWALERRVRPGDAVALLMENRPEYIMAWYGLAKIGAVTAMINTHTHAHSLAHCLNISHADYLVLGAECLDSYRSAAGNIEREIIPWITGRPAEGIRDLDEALARQSPQPLGRAHRQGVKTGDVCFYIYTSGTTGLPKAAKLTHLRVGLMMHAFSAATRARESDRMYIALPLYHSAGGIVAVGTTMTVGGSIVVRRQFSATHFWDDCVKYRATMFQYIGEFCRYLLNTPFNPNETAHVIRKCVGNGLRPDIWLTFSERFKLPRILEFYGSTEGNVTLMNFDGKPGAIGRVPKYLAHRFPYKLVKFDVEKEVPVRGSDRLCREAAAGEVGEMLGQIRADDPKSRVSRYTNDDEMDKKILRDVFAPGDAWFRTGDLMRKDQLDYFYFVDRIGDTFRWKGENVATSEVAEVLSVFSGVQEANVYGVHVPRTDGRAGMATLIVEDEFDLQALNRHLTANLPDYAVPLFLRLTKQISATGTFKQHKVDHVKEGFDPGVISEPIYFRKSEAEGYVPVDRDLYDRICSGRIRI